MQSIDHETKKNDRAPLQQQRNEEELQQLMTAIEERNLDQVKHLLETVGVNPNQSDRAWETGFSQTPLDKAVCKKDLGIVEALLKANANVNGRVPDHVDPPQYREPLPSEVVVCRNFWTPDPLLSAVDADKEGDNLEVVKALLAAGASPNGRPWEEKYDCFISDSNFFRTPLELACSLHRSDVAEALMEAGADVNLPNRHSGTTPLMMARDWSVLVELLARKADVNATSAEGLTPLMHQMTNPDRNYIVSILNVPEHNPHVVDNEGNSAFHYCSRNGHAKEEAVKFLSMVGLDINATNKLGQTPFYKAVLKNWPGNGENQLLLRDMLKHGADPTIQVDGESALHAIARMFKDDSDETADLMRDLFGETNQFLENTSLSLDAMLDAHGRTALMVACDHGSLAVARAFILNITAGPSVSRKCQEGKTALFRACEGNHLSIIRMLLPKTTLPDADDCLVHFTSTASLDIVHLLVEAKAERGHLQ